MAGVPVSVHVSKCEWQRDKEPSTVPDLCKAMSVLLCLGLSDVTCECLCPQEGLSLYSQLPGSVRGF